MTTVMYQIDIWFIIILTSLTIGTIIIGFFIKRYAMVSFIFGNISMGGVWYGIERDYLPMGLFSIMFIFLGTIITATIFKYKKIKEEIIE